MSDFITMPGTETKVMPDTLAPIMPKATIYHGDRLLPRKKVSFVALRPVAILLYRDRRTK